MFCRICWKCPGILLPTSGRYHFSFIFQTTFADNIVKLKYFPINSSLISDLPCSYFICYRFFLFFFKSLCRVRKNQVTFRVMPNGKGLNPSSVAAKTGTVF